MVEDKDGHQRLKNDQRPTTPARSDSPGVNSSPGEPEIHSLIQLKCGHLLKMGQKGRNTQIQEWVLVKKCHRRRWGGGSRGDLLHVERWGLDCQVLEGRARDQLCQHRIPSFIQARPRPRGGAHGMKYGPEGQSQETQTQKQEK